MKALEPGFPVDALTLMLSLRCSLACSYCLRHAPEEEMTEARAHRAVSLLFARGTGPKDLTFSGGEPLLLLERLRGLAKMARVRAAAAGIRLRLNVLTNAVALSPEALDYLSDGDVRVVVSTAGEPASHDRHRRDAAGAGSWARVEKGVDALVKRLPPERLIATMPVHPELAHRLRADFAYLTAKGLRHFNICAVFGVPWTARQTADLASQYAGVLADAVASARGERPVVVQGLGSRFRALTGSSPARDYSYSDSGGTHCPLSFRLTAWPDGVLSVNAFRFGPEAGRHAVGGLDRGFLPEFMGCAPGTASCKGDACRRRLVELDRAYGASYMEASGTDPEGFRRAWDANVLLCEGAMNRAAAEKIWKLSAGDPALRRYMEVSDSWCDLVG